jgi:hypothetical protein
MNKFKNFFIYFKAMVMKIQGTGRGILYLLVFTYLTGGNSKIPGNGCNTANTVKHGTQGRG